MSSIMCVRCVCFSPRCLVSSDLSCAFPSRFRSIFPSQHPFSLAQTIYATNAAASGKCGKSSHLEHVRSACILSFDNFKPRISRFPQSFLITLFLQWSITPLITIIGYINHFYRLNYVVFSLSTRMPSHFRHCTKISIKVFVIRHLDGNETNKWNN